MMIMMIVYLTSDDGQFGGHRDFTFCVSGDAFVSVLVARRSEWLDTQHCSRPFIKLYGLDQWESGNEQTSTNHSRSQLSDQQSEIITHYDQHM